MQKTKKGFTLIELLIVIAIIGILAGVVLVSTNSAQNKAKEQQGRSTMRSALTYMTLCVSNGGTINAYNGSGGNICSDANTTDAKWPATPSGCASNFSVSGNVLTGNCGGVTINCNAASGQCQ